jgi:hypothetical protein
MLQRIIQGSILAALVVIAGLLFNISRKLNKPSEPAPVMTPAAAPAPVVEPAPQPAAPAVAPQPAPRVTRVASAPKPSPLGTRTVSASAPAPTVPAPAPPPPSPDSGLRLPSSSGSDTTSRSGSVPDSIQNPASYSVVYGPNSAANVPPPPPPPPPVKTVTVPAGTAFTVRLLDHLSTEKNRAGDTFAASLDEALVVDGVTVANRGAMVTGRVVNSKQSGRIAGLAEMALEIDRIQTTGGDVQIASDTMIREAEASKTKDAAKVGILAGIGAAIGAIAGGRKGAGIGAASGGTAGTIGVMASRGKPVEYPPESRLTFRLRAPITVQADSTRAQSSPLSDRPYFTRRP